MDGYQKKMKRINLINLNICEIILGFVAEFIYLRRMAEIVMYIFVNSDLQMAKGKTCAQCSHITGKIIAELVRMGYDTYPPPTEFIQYKIWENNCTKIILKATQNELNELMKHQNARCFIDSGDRIPDNSVTVVGFLPTTIDSMQDITKNFKLL